MKTNKVLVLAGTLWIAAAVTFWLSWFLMPDPGTTDTEHILQMVKQSRNAVLASVIVQIFSSVLFIFALFALAKTVFSLKKIYLTGIALVGVGAMGFCADAFFHLLAWYMTDSSVTIQKDVVQVMEFMQTSALNFLIPLLLPFFAGTLLLANSLRRTGITSGLPVILLSIVIIAGPAAIIIANKVFGYSGPWMSQVPIGIFAAALVLLGIELIRSGRQQQESFIVSGIYPVSS